MRRMHSAKCMDKITERQMLVEERVSSSTARKLSHGVAATARSITARFACDFAVRPAAPPRLA